MNRIISPYWLTRILFLPCAVCVSLFSEAQLCIGSLGDPVVNLTFGSGANTGQGFTAPGYTYVTSSCPNDGFYTITSSTSGCFSNSWHTVNADHTGNGAFLLVNASNQPADFFITTVTGLCPNTTYEFSAWILNVLVSASGIQPNLTFNIETPSGVILSTFNTGNIAVTAQPDWKQYGFFFTTTPGNPVIVLRITNNAPGGIGNDLAMDDITFRPCGPVLSSSIQGSSNIVDQCINLQSNYTFDAVVSPGFLLPVYQWQVSTDSGVLWKDIPGANTLLYQRQPTPAGNYWYRLTVAESGNAGLSACRIGSNVLIINVFPKPVIIAGPDRIILSGKQTILTATTNDINNVINWLPPDFLSSTSILNPVAAPDRDMYYSIFAVSPYGCTNEDQVFIKVVAGIFVPTAFTPNNDGTNDHWNIPYLEPMPGVSVRVYNRWGQVVYQVAGSQVDWDGSYAGIPQPAGTYVYFIHFKDGSPDMKGTVTIIR